MAYLSTVGTVVLALTACASVPSSSPFPRLGPLKATDRVQVVQSRTTGLRTLAAVLAVAFSWGERQGTFEMVVNYDAAGQTRFTAFKELGFSTQPIFDLLLSSATYHLEVHNEASARTRQGNVARFVQDNPEFRSFLLVGEAFFLPGFDGFGNPPVFTTRTAARCTTFTTRLKSGLIAQWFARPDTLEITRARLRGNGAQASVSLFLEYGDYRQMATYYIPHRVTLTDRQLGFTTRALAKQVDINIPLPSDVFEMPLPPQGSIPVPPARSEAA
jgi:hypothetical protein